jgi:hypothetical protein
VSQPATLPYVRKRSRRTVSPQHVHNDTSAGRAINWCYPWTVQTYPGRERGVLALLGQSVTWAAVQHWRNGRRPLPSWAATALAVHIEARLESGKELVAELRELAKVVKPRKRRGWEVTDEQTGLSRRKVW